MSFDSECLKETGSLSQSMLRKYRITEARFHEPLDRFSIVRFHYNVRFQTDVGKKAVNNYPDIAPLRIQQPYR